MSPYTPTRRNTLGGVIMLGLTATGLVIGRTGTDFVAGKTSHDVGTLTNGWIGVKRQVMNDPFVSIPFKFFDTLGLYWILLRIVALDACRAVVSLT